MRSRQLIEKMVPIYIGPIRFKIATEKFAGRKNPADFKKINAPFKTHSARIELLKPLKIALITFAILASSFVLRNRVNFKKKSNFFFYDALNFP